MCSNPREVANKIAKVMKSTAVLAEEVAEPGLSEDMCLPTRLNFVGASIGFIHHIESYVEHLADIAEATLADDPSGLAAFNSEMVEFYSSRQAKMAKRRVAFEEAAGRSNDPNDPSEPIVPKDWPFSQPDEPSSD